MERKMKILMSSHFFHPSVGGIEQVSLTLALEFARAGHQVKVITTTRESDLKTFPFEIVRRPSATRLWELVHWSEVVFHNNISLRVCWPLAVIRRPWVVAHHTWMRRTDSSIGFRDRLKRFVIRFALNIAVSRPVADHLRVPSTIIGNPYREDLFKRDPCAERRCDLIFVGRLVTDKGVDILLQALSRLKHREFFPCLTIVGDGPDLPRLSAMVREYKLTDQVTFLGTTTGQELVKELNQHRIIVVPSRWQEPFGLVALEGVACGCRAIVAESGGLQEAAGPLAIVFWHESDSALADAIQKALTEGFDWESYWQAIAPHLRAHSAAGVAQKYLDIFAKASTGHR